MFWETELPGLGQFMNRSTRQEAAPGGFLLPVSRDSPPDLWDFRIGKNSIQDFKILCNLPRHLALCSGAKSRSKWTRYYRHLDRGRHQGQDAYRVTWAAEAGSAQLQVPSPNWNTMRWNSQNRERLKGQEANRSYRASSSRSRQSCAMTTDWLWHRSRREASKPGKSQKWIEGLWESRVARSSKKEGKRFLNCFTFLSTSLSWGPNMFQMLLTGWCNNDWTTYLNAFELHFLEESMCSG